MKPLTPAAVHAFHATVYAYYEKEGRHELAWRRTSDPYRILVSEFMLQQTQVPRVIAKYQEFIAAFPSITTLVRAPLQEVLRVWSGLGYNRRALSLKKAAERIVAEHQGRVPREPEILATLPGIGPATAAEIAAFAFGKAVPFIETNIRAVFIHEFFAKKKRVSDAEILPLVEQTLDRDDPRRWYYALMDYGVMLKKRVENPSRKSAHHVKQARFEGSNREKRGMLLKALTQQQGGIALQELSKATGLGRDEVKTVIAALKREGFVIERKRRFWIA